MRPLPPRFARASTRPATAEADDCVQESYHSCPGNEVDFPPRPIWQIGATINKNSDECWCLFDCGEALDPTADPTLDPQARSRRPKNDCGRATESNDAAAGIRF
jgi:hypothetical protein